MCFQPWQITQRLPSKMRVLMDALILERSKLETILTRVEDGVIVVDPEGRLLLVEPYHPDSLPPGIG